MHEPHVFQHSSQIAWPSQKATVIQLRGLDHPGPVEKLICESSQCGRNASFSLT